MGMCCCFRAGEGDGGGGAKGPRNGIDRFLVAPESRGPFNRPHAGLPSGLNAAKLLAFTAFKLSHSLTCSGVRNLDLKGNRRSSAMRSISKRIASEMDNPIASNASAARAFVSAGPTHSGPFLLLRTQAPRLHWQ